MSFRSTFSSPAARLVRFLRLDTLLVRLLLVFLVGFAVIQAVNSALWHELRMYHRQLGIEEAAMRMVTYVRTLESLPAERRGAFVDMLRDVYGGEIGAAEAWFVYGDGAPPAVEDDRRPVRAYAAAVRGTLAAAGLERTVRVRALGGDRSPDPAHPVPHMVTCVELSDGTWMTVAHKRNQGMYGPALVRAQAGQTVAVILTCLLAVVLVVRSTRPLARLAAGAEAFGRSPELSGPMPENEGTREIREVSTSFNRMRERICAEFEERDRIMAAMAHDLRTPLTRARLALERLHPERERRNLAMDLGDIELFVTRGLEYARSRGSTEKRVVMDVGAFLESLCDDLAADGRDVTFVPGGANRGPLLVKVGLSSLKRCVNNLLDNALAYGGRVRVSVDAAGDHVRIRVEDDGPGIPEDMLEKVFRPYFRLEGSRNASFGGLGLGLSIARNMAHHDRGTVELANGAEGGLVATVTLPRHVPARNGGSGGSTGSS